MKNDQLVFNSPISSQLVSGSIIIVSSFGMPSFVYANGFLDDWQDQLNVRTYTDARTDDNANEEASLWNIDLGADKYRKELYERPTSEMIGSLEGLPAAETYYEFLDISTASVALDKENEHAYFSIDLVGDAAITNGVSSVQGFNETYRVRVSSKDDFASTETNVSGYMFSVTGAGGSLTDSFSSENSFSNTQVWFDDPLDGGVTGTGLTTTDEGAFGYAEMSSLGATSDISARLVDNSIQLAIDYGNLDINKSVFRNLLFEANSGDTDPLNAFLNDEYSETEAGSPYDFDNTPDSIYEIDTLKGQRGGNGLKAAPIAGLGSSYSAFILMPLLLMIWRRKRAENEER